MVREHNTDEGSLLFVGSYLCRLTFPLCYNFLNMVQDDESVFVLYQGKAVSLAPLFGEGYNKWLPQIILVVCIITLLNIHIYILRFLTIKQYSYHDIKPGDPLVEEGRSIIEHARNLEQRRNHRELLGSGSNLRGVSNHMTAKELLDRYKAGSVKNAEENPKPASGLFNIFKNNVKSVGDGGGTFHRLQNEEDVDSPPPQATQKPTSGVFGTTQSTLGPSAASKTTKTGSSNSANSNLRLGAQSGDTLKTASEVKPPANLNLTPATQSKLSSSVIKPTFSKTVAQTSVSSDSNQPDRPAPNNNFAFFPAPNASTAAASSKPAFPATFSNFLSNKSPEQPKMPTISKPARPRGGLFDDV